MSSPQHIDDLITPVVLLDRKLLDKNIRSMQDVCDAHGVELWPHMKTHKMVEVAKRQLAAGAKGLTCAKVGEAEAMLPSGVKRIFIAHSLVDVRVAPRLAALADQLDELRVAVTSVAHAGALVKVAEATNRRLKVVMAVDTGLDREGVRDLESAKTIAGIVAACPRLELVGIYTHEGQLYGVDPAERAEKIVKIQEKLMAVRDAVDPTLPLLPGCSVSAKIMAESGKVQAVRPGSYMFGDMSLATTTKVMSPEDVAINMLATVVDRPAPGIALIDAGRKVFSADKTKDLVSAIAADGREIRAVKLSEEHGVLEGADVEALKIGDRIRFITAHVCTGINLTDSVTVVEGDQIVDTWKVDARGKVS